MLGFWRKRVWKEHVKLATQSFLASQYLVEFEKNVAEAGLEPASPFRSAAEDDLSTSIGYLETLRSGEQLPSMTVTDALKMNRDLRRTYDAILKGRKMFASRFDSISEQLLPFDRMFTPSGGWARYLDNFQTSQTPTRPKAGSNPAQQALLQSLQDMPEERFQELASMGAELAKLKTDPISSEALNKVCEPAARWTVHVDDNFHYMDESERYTYGSFDDYEVAVVACRKIVDDYLSANSAETADELYESYVSFGEDPWIEGPPPGPSHLKFSARDYALKRCEELRS